jgi:hypothetical protein
MYMMPLTMDYDSMSLIDLKQQAKCHTPKIKQYYIMTRVQLIQILKTNVFSEEMIVSKKTIAELRKEAQERKLPNIWKLRRAELVELLYPSSKKDNQNNNDRKKHDGPQKGDSNEIRIDIVKNPE